MNDCQCTHIKNVSTTMAELFKDGLYLDVSIHIDNDEFQSNRLLLAASSGYFRASLNFNHCSKIQEYFNVSYDYVSHVGLQHVIAYINSLGHSCHSIPASDYVEVYTASSFLQVDHLKTWMSQCLENSLCAGNVLCKFVHTTHGSDYLKLADLFDDAQLLHKATFVLRSEFHAIDYHSEDFINLTENQIENIFTSDKINVPTEGAMVEALLSWVCGDIEGRMPFFRNNFAHLVRLPLIGVPELRKIVTNPRFASAGSALEMLQVAHSVLTNPYHGEVIRKHEYLSRLAASTNQCKVRSGTGYRIYAVGGIQQSPDNISSVFNQGEDGFYVYDHNLSTATALMPPSEVCRVHHAVAASLNWLYIIGGESEDGQLLNHCSRYSLTEHEWCPMAELTEPRSHHSVTCIENLVYVFGGYSLNWSCGYSPATSSVLVYDPLRNSWRQSTQQLPLGLVDMGNVLIPGKHAAMLAGGLEEYGDQMRPSDRVFLYDPTDEIFQSFTELPKLPAPLVNVALAYDDINKRVFACGGRFWRSTTTNWTEESNDISNKIYSYSFITNTWCFVTILDFPRFASSAFVHNGNLYLLGGLTSDHAIESSSDLIFSALQASMDELTESNSSRSNISTLQNNPLNPITLFWEKLSRENSTRPDFLQSSFRTCHFVEAWKLLINNSNDPDQSFPISPSSSSSPSVSTQQPILKRFKLAHSRREDDEFVLTRCLAAFCMAPYHDLSNFP